MKCTLLPRLTHCVTAPFISRLLIQRLVTSNPSPRYTQVVAEAFSTGTYNGKTYSGMYGDLLATVTAIFLDREASSSTLDSDPAHGRMREPLVKVLHFMRAMKHTPTNGRQEVEMSRLEDKIGQQYALSPTVFNYYLPDYQPVGKVANAEMVAPEAELGTAPYMVGFLNGMTSLIKHGLTDCDWGFASNKNRKGKSCSADPTSDNDGYLTFTPQSSSAVAIVDELSLLLTASRLNKQATNSISAAYEQYDHKISQGVQNVGRGCWKRCASRQGPCAFCGTGLCCREGWHDTTSGCDGSDLNNKEHTCVVPPPDTLKANKLKIAFQLMMVSAEFHATNLNKLSATLRTPVDQTTSLDRKYKAVVVIFLSGGADSFNMVVPHSNCGPHDLYKEYADIRGEIALDKEDLLTIDVDNQPCQQFGLHPKMPFIKELYDDGDAAFLANIGALVEPVTKQEYKDKSKELPPNLFAHNIMQKSAATVHAQYGAADGILGRIVGDLGSKTRTNPYKTALYSLAGNEKILEGSHSVIIDTTDGVIGYTGHDELHETIDEMLTYNHSESYFADTYTNLLQSAVGTNQALGAILSSGGATLTQRFEQDMLSKQLRQVAKLTKTRDQLQTERAGFLVRLTGFDSHSGALEVLEDRLNWIDAGLKSFVNEMKDQGIWEDVTIVTMSDFGRTLTSNGQGNDHAWGGINVVLGGDVDGRKILGQYPERLGEGSDLNIGRGRILPTIGWESIWYGLSEWMGVQPGNMATVLPNAARFASKQLFGADVLFHSTVQPTEAPTEEPAAQPTEAPTAPHTEEPTAKHTEEPTAQPTEKPTAQPTEEPTAHPTEVPTAQPTEEPTTTATSEPSTEPTRNCFKTAHTDKLCKRVLENGLIKNITMTLATCQTECMQLSGCKMFSFKETTSRKKANVCKLCKNSLMKAGTNFKSYRKRGGC